MTRPASIREIVVNADRASLSGSAWVPSDSVATVLMHPGSGPTDRDNDGYFVPIRQALLRSGFAVCSFDKRGVGDSTGRWQDAGIVEQADDLLACLGLLLSDREIPKPVGLFGHSQGGWVVIEAAGRKPEIAFVIANSGPGVAPAEQERYTGVELPSVGLPCLTGPAAAPEWNPASLRKWKRGEQSVPGSEAVSRSRGRRGRAAHTTARATPG
jgi:pimeloyl-ACP methyl ester carboxylesterase